MQETRQLLLSLLADGRFHSGQALGARLGISRAAVWKQVGALQALGLDVCRVPGRGYRLDRPLELLDIDRISRALPGDLGERISLHVFDCVDSTNAFLMRAKDAGVMAALAEQQTAGRGRRGREWVSPFGANLYLSMSWPFESLPPDFSALGLAAGVGAWRALRDRGVESIGLKWPNDLYAAGAKLGGILLEMRGEPPGPCRVVAGIGINVRMPHAAAGAIDQRWVDLATLTGERLISRNDLAAAVLQRWFEIFDEFSRTGFASFHEEWRRADVLAGREVEVIDGARRWQGRALGVAPDGILEIDTSDGVRRLVAGDVSLREAS